MKTSKLTGAALDYAVAIALGGKNFRWDTVSNYWITIDGKDRVFSKGWSASQNFAPSELWSQGGPLIEGEKIRLVFRDLGKDSYWCAEAFEAYRNNQYVDGKGPTPLIAAMRCYVASKLGDEVEIPEGLK